LELFVHLDLDIKGLHPGFEVWLGGNSFYYFEADQAVDNDVNGALRHFYGFQDRGGGPDGVNVIEIGIVGFGILLRNKTYDGFIGFDYLKQIFASLPPDGQRGYSSRVDNDISDRQNANYIGQFQFVIMFLQFSAFIVQRLFWPFDGKCGNIAQPHTAGV
jgi:hypothetical protein